MSDGDQNSIKGAACSTLYRKTGPIKYHPNGYNVIKVYCNDEGQKQLLMQAEMLGDKQINPSEPKEGYKRDAAKNKKVTKSVKGVIKGVIDELGEADIIEALENQAPFLKAVRLRKQ